MQKTLAEPPIAVEKTQQEPEGLKRMRMRSFDALLELEQKSNNSEAYRFMQQALDHADLFEKPQKCSLQKADILPFVLPACLQSHIVFINGTYLPALSDASTINTHCKVLSTKDAWRSYSALLKNAMNKTCKECTNSLVYLNAAHHTEGVFLYLGPKCIQENPVQIVSIVTDCCWAMPRMHLFAGPSSQLSLIHTKHLLSTKNNAYNATFDFTLEDNARVTFEEINTTQNDVSVSFEAIDVVLKRSSYFCHTFVEDAENTRRDIRAQLVDDGADVSLNGIWAVNKQKTCYTNVLVEHLAPHCTSMQRYKGVLAGKAKSYFQGKIYVQKEAQKTESYQRNNNLLLSDQAEASSRPNLEIFADDVKASHGATVGKLEDESLFYMKSRGISESDAKIFLVKGFCQEIVAKLTIPLLQERAYTSLTNMLYDENTSH